MLYDQRSSLSLSIVQFISIGFAIIYNAFVKHGIPADERPSIYHAAHRTIKRVTVVTTQANIRLPLVSIFHSFERKLFVESGRRSARGATRNHVTSESSKFGEEGASVPTRN